MTDRFWIDDFRVEPVKQGAHHLISGDFKMVGAASAGTDLLKSAYSSGELTNLAFTENGERLAFPAFVTFYDESHGVVTAVIRPAGAPS
jgi:hypothetical protein